MISDGIKEVAITYGKKKAGETLSDPEKFQDALDKFSQNKSFLKLKDIRDKASQKDKKRVYEEGKQAKTGTINKIIDPLNLGILQSIKKINPISGIRTALKYQSKGFRTMSLLLPGQTFEPALRLCVHLGLLSKPDFLTQEQMLADMQLDFKSLNTKLSILEILATIIPWLRPALPLIQEIKKYGKQVGEAGIQNLVINRQDQEAEKLSNEIQPVKEAAKGTTSLDANIKTTKIKEIVEKDKGKK